MNHSSSLIGQTLASVKEINQGFDNRILINVCPHLLLTRACLDLNHSPQDKNFHLTLFPLLTKTFKIWLIPHNDFLFWRIKCLDAYV